MAELSDCGTIKLISKVFGADEDTLKKQFGLPVFVRPGQHFCKHCGEELHEKFKQLCQHCRILTLACDECGITFIRSTWKVLYGQGKLNFQYVWCSKLCQGRWLAREHGFARKWDRGLVKHLRAKDYKRREISELLAMPITTVDFILYREGMTFKPRKEE